MLVAQKVTMGVYKGVTTSELDELAAETAASMTATHPDYALVRTQWHLIVSATSSIANQAASGSLPSAPALPALHQALKSAMYR